MSSQSREGGPSWGREDEWREANMALARLKARNGFKLSLARRKSLEIADNLNWLFPWLDEFCALTCPACQDVCCQAVRVWFDFRDLVFWRLASLHPPPAQTRSSLAEPCRYLAPSGCRLERILRPWICTWYLCAAQLELLRQKPPRLQRAFEARLRAVMEARREMEAEFIRATS